MEKSQNPRFNMQGYLIELDKQTHRWTWSKWEYRKDWEGKKRVIRRSGSLEFMKIFPTVLSASESGVGNIKINNQEQMEAELKKTGVDFIFLYQGETLEERGFKTIAQAEAFHQLESCPQWNLTGYWFSFDWNMQSWAMYDAFTGELKFTPPSAVRRLKDTKRTQVSNPLPDHASRSLATVH
jgi:hypothetical protein